jgi:hypothetical protein
MLMRGFGCTVTLKGSVMLCWRCWRKVPYPPLSFNMTGQCRPCSSVGGWSYKHSFTWSFWQILVSFDQRWHDSHSIAECSKVQNFWWFGIWLYPISAVLSLKHWMSY